MRFCSVSRRLLPSADAGCGRALGLQQPRRRSQAPATSEVPAAAPALSQVERGKMLIIGGGCHDCHTPKKMGPNGPEADMDRMLSGHPESEGVPPPFKPIKGSPYVIHINDHLTAWSGAWGVSFAANLTPDQNTGLGIWTEDMFVTALKQGKHMGNEPADSAADAVELVRAAARRRSEGDVRVSEVDQADRQPRARAAHARRQATIEAARNAPFGRFEEVGSPRAPDLRRAQRRLSLCLAGRSRDRDRCTPASA